MKKFPQDFAIINVNFASSSKKQFILLVTKKSKKERKKERKELKSKYRKIIPKVSNHNKLVYLVRLGF